MIYKKSVLYLNISSRTYIILCIFIMNRNTFRVINKVDIHPFETKMIVNKKQMFFSMEYDLERYNWTHTVCFFFAFSFVFALQAWFIVRYLCILVSHTIKRKGPDALVFIFTSRKKRYSEKKNTV
jgi:hypothetical protein